MDGASRDSELRDLEGLGAWELGSLGPIRQYKSKRVAIRKDSKAAAVICSSKLTRAF